MNPVVSSYVWQFGQRPTRYLASLGARQPALSARHPRESKTQYLPEGHTCPEPQVPGRDCVRSGQVSWCPHRTSRKTAGTLCGAAQVSRVVREVLADAGALPPLPNTQSPLKALLAPASAVTATLTTLFMDMLSLCP